MSVNTYRNNITRIQGQIADIKKKEASERKKEINLISKINDLSKRITKSRSALTSQSIQRQIDSKFKEKVRAQTKIADYQKQITNKQKQIDQNQNSLTRALDQEAKKRQNTELNFFKSKESYNRNELNSIKK